MQNKKQISARCSPSVSRHNAVTQRSKKAKLLHRTVDAATWRKVRKP